MPKFVPCPLCHGRPGGYSPQWTMNGDPPEPGCGACDETGNMAEYKRLNPLGLYELGFGKRFTKAQIRAFENELPLEPDNEIPFIDPFEEN